MRVSAGGVGCLFWLLIIWLVFMGGCDAVYRVTQHIGQ